MTQLTPKPYDFQQIACTQDGDLTRFINTRTNEGIEIRYDFDPFDEVPDGHTHGLEVRGIQYVPETETADAFIHHDEVILEVLAPNTEEAEHLVASTHAYLLEECFNMYRANDGIVFSVFVSYLVSRAISYVDSTDAIALLRQKSNRATYETELLLDLEDKMQTTQKEEAEKLRLFLSKPLYAKTPIHDVAQQLTEAVTSGHIRNHTLLDLTYLANFATQNEVVYFFESLFKAWCHESKRGTLITVDEIHKAVPRLAEPMYQPILAFLQTMDTALTLKS